MKRRTRSLVPLVAALALAAGPALAQDTPAPQAKGPKAHLPVTRALTRFAPLNFKETARWEASQPQPAVKEVGGPDAPHEPPIFPKHVPIAQTATKLAPLATTSFGTGISPGPAKTFKAEYLSGGSIPPDTMGAVGPSHVVTVSNDRMHIQTREGVELSRMTLSSFWSSVTLKGQVISAFDPKVLYDRFNDRFILIASGNAQTYSSGAMFAVTATGDPTGTWYRFTVTIDPLTDSSATGGRWIDYPSMGHNKNWIVINYNAFNWGTAGTGYWGQLFYVLDKQAFYANTLVSASLFEGDYNNVCLASATQETELSCGFTMAPAITEDATTDPLHIVEDWDSTNAQLRVSKLTGTPAAPVLTVGLQFPQSPYSWRYNASRISTSGGYLPQRQQSANSVSSTRIMANDSRIQNTVLRNGKLWTVHTVMLAATNTAAGTGFGTSNPDVRSAVQWWQIDPTIETGAAAAPLQRARIEDPAADNCHNGASANRSSGCTGTSFQTGEFFAFPNISVNKDDDVFIGFTRFSAFAYPSSAYAIRRASDTANTTRDLAVYRPGQANYNIGSGTGSTRQNRWGDYSAAQTDPVNDTDFWTVQEYSGTYRNDFLGSYACPWETWWALVSPSATAPVSTGTLLINEFRLRGPQGVRDEYVELVNPGTAPLIVKASDGSEGWALAFSADGTAVTGVAVIPNGTVIPPGGHFLLCDNPDSTAGGTSALTYSLNAYAGIAARGADSDTGWALDLADNGGLALFTTSKAASFAAGTRVDSVGFATIAAGLFKEGTGIAAIAATTPAGQMAFQRDHASGAPKDTGDNAADFRFVDPVAETLTVQPKLGAAGPENLSGPVHLPSGGALDSAVLDSGFGPGAPPNYARSMTAVTNGAFGTMAFRRRFTNNTGSALTRLRFRVVDITTTPVTGGTADLRALTSSDASVPVSAGGNASVKGLTLEEAPTQALGGGFNASLSVPSVTAAAPLAAGATLDVQFLVGVQVSGIYTFCLVPEAIQGAASPAASPTLCFTGNTASLPVELMKFAID